MLILIGVVEMEEQELIRCVYLSGRWVGKLCTSPVDDFAERGILDVFIENADPVMYIRVDCAYLFDIEMMGDNNV